MSLHLESPSKKSSLKTTVLFFIGGALIGGMLTAGFFMNRQRHQAANTDLGEMLFKVDGNTYMASNLPGDTAMAYYQLQNSIYEAKANFANQAALRLALAKEQKANTNELPAMEELLVVTDVTDVEVQNYYTSIKSRYGEAVFGGQSYDQLKPQLKQQLTRQKQDQAMNSKVHEYTSNGRIISLLAKPDAPVVALNVEGYPTRGNVSSSVVLVEVADYMCPHCRETEQTVNKLYNEFKDKVKFVQVSYPLQAEGLNGALARGAFCASQQGQEQFWNYHTNAFQTSFDKMTPKNSTSAAASFNNEATEVASKSGLDLEKFNSCLESDSAKQYITRLQSDFNAKTGFQGTPTFYINNKLVQANPNQLEATLRQALKNVSN